MKKNTNPDELQKCRKILTLCLVFLFSCTVLTGKGVAIEIAAQNVSANFINVPLKDVIWELQKQTDFTFIYSTNDVKSIVVKNVSVNNEIVTSVLEKCLENTGLTYNIHNGVIAIKKSEAPAVAVEAPQQRATVTGVVVDNNGDPMPGVNVLVKGTQTGAITDLDGRFTIDVSSGDGVVLQVSFIGFTTREIVATPEKPLRIVMEDNSKLLDEVVITGYGTFKKTAYAGSASTVRTQGMEEVPAIGFSTLLQGNAPGIQVSSASGQPGSSTSITIRGLGSFNASSSPLYVIDGVPVISGDIGTSTDAGTDIMATINNSDIESITVIKDAAAASLYGSRAANGVIIITTKSGKQGKPVFNLKADLGFSNFSMPFIETLSGEERREIFLEGYYNYAKEKLTMPAPTAEDPNNKRPFTEEESWEYAANNIDNIAAKPWSGWTDWNDVLFRKDAPFRNYEFSASGADNKISYYTSLAYTDQKGLSYQQDFSRISGRLNVRYKMTDRIELGANILYSSISQDVNSEGGTYTSPIYSSRHKVSGSDAVYNEDGTYNQKLLSNGVRNPKMAADMNYKKQKARRSFNTIFANLKIIDGLIFNTTFSFDNTNTRYKQWDDPRSSDGASSNGSLTATAYQYDQIVWKNSLNYITTLHNKHNFDVLAGYETYDYKREYLSGTVKDFPTVEKHQIANGANITGLGGYESGWRLISYLSRINYNYSDKYFLGVSARVDGSSRLHRDERWGTFWSASAAWRLSEEEFMKPLSPVLSEVKLRASYGSNGTLPSGYYGYMDLVSFGYSYNAKPAVIEYQIGNKDLKWEKNYNFNIGLDFRLFDRVNATVEWYNRNTSDLLMDLPISHTTGFPTILLNTGRVQNKGIEVDLNAEIVRYKDFIWTSSLNFGHNKNIVKDLGGQEEIKSGAYMRKIGKPYYSFYVIEFAGIDPQDGVPQFYINDPEKPNDRSITKDTSEANSIIYKSAEPSLTGGWSNSFKYKIVDLNFTFTYSLGGYSYDRSASKLETSGNNTLDNVQALYKDRWRKAGDVTSIEKFMVNNSYDMSKITNSRRIHSTDHLRLKNVTLGVSLPKHIIRPIGLSNVRLFCSGVNLLTWAAYDRYDPEVQRNGDFYFHSPKLKTITFGIDVKF